LKEEGVLVRHFTAPRIANYTRITIGTDEQMTQMLYVLTNILKGTKTK
jgi:histidinol-phosphate aminotransferase